MAPTTNGQDCRAAPGQSDHDRRRLAQASEGGRDLAPRLPRRHRSAQGRSGRARTFGESGFCDAAEFFVAPCRAHGQRSQARSTIERRQLNHSERCRRDTQAPAWDRCRAAPEAPHSRRGRGGTVPGRRGLDGLRLLAIDRRARRCHLHTGAGGRRHVEHRRSGVAAGLRFPKPLFQSGSAHGISQPRMLQRLSHGASARRIRHQKPAEDRPAAV